MPADRSRVPTYCRFQSKQRKQRGLPSLAYIRIAGRVRYLGERNSPKSLEEYKRILTDLPSSACATVADSPKPLDAPGDEPDPLAACREAGRELTVCELCAAYLDYADGYYVKDGRPTDQMGHVRRAIRVANDLYGHARAVEFGPMALEKVRDWMVRFEGTHPGTKRPLRYSRITINSTCDGIRRIFKWAVRKELVPSAVHHALMSVPGLKTGRTTAREPLPIMPVTDQVVDATLPYVSCIVADMVRIQRLSGARPGEVCNMRPMDLKPVAKVWEYRPASHKTQHHGRERVIFLGPKAQSILHAYLLRPADAYCFSPAESEEKRRATLHNRRVAPLNRGNRPRKGQKRKTARVVSTHYCKDAYRRAIVRGVALANQKITKEAARDGVKPRLLPAWHPNMLRHSAATEIRRRFGLEAAQTVLGHAKANTTEIYAERDYARAAGVMEQIG